MKRIYIILLAALTFLISCEKNNDSPVNVFQGKWMIKKSYSDPGNGSGRYTDVPDPNSSITFGPDSLVISNFEYFGWHMLKSFKVTDSVQVRFSFQPQSSFPQTPYRYELVGDTLILNPPCIEGCGIKLVKAPAQ